MKRCDNNRFIITVSNKQTIIPDSVAKIVTVENTRFILGVNEILQSDSSKVKGQTKRDGKMHRRSSTGKETLNTFTNFPGRYRMAHKEGHRQK